MASANAARPAGARGDNPGCRGDVLAAADVIAEAVEVLRSCLDRPPLAQLGAIVEAERTLADARHALVVDVMLDPIGTASWADVGRVLGISRQGARKVYDPDVIAEIRRRRHSRMTE